MTIEKTFYIKQIFTSVGIDWLEVGDFAGRSRK